MRPDDPAFIDSLGWIEYRQGNLQRSVELLRRALQMLPNHEVAAHLGEVLWVAGEQAEAREIWRFGLELEPDSVVVQDTIRRLTGDPADVLLEVAS